MVYNFFTKWLVFLASGMFLCLAFCPPLLAYANENEQSAEVVLVDSATRSGDASKDYVSEMDKETKDNNQKEIAISILKEEPESSTPEYYEASYMPVYNFEYYSSHNDDLFSAYGSDRYAYFNHFLNWGMSEGRKGNATFDVLSYFNQYADLRNAYQTNLKEYYLHYLNFGIYEGRNTSDCNTLQNPTSMLNSVDYSPVYEPSFYMQYNLDVVTAFTYRGKFVNDIAILQHFINYGMNEGRQGNTSFKVINYYNRNSDIRWAYGMNLHDCYMHYLYFGLREGRNISDCPDLQGWITNGWSAVYDPQFYYNNNGDLKAIATKVTIQGTFINDKWLWEHANNWGASEWRPMNEAFDVTSYYYANSDLRLAFQGNTKAYYTHYIGYGKAEGRTCKGVTSIIGKLTICDGFNYANVYNPDYYVSAYSDINENAHFTRRGVRFLNDGWAMWHFVNWGMNEERTGNGSFYPRSYWCQYSDIRRACGSYMPNLYRHYCDYGKREGRAGSGYWTLSGDIDFDNRLIALTRQFPTLWSAFDWVCSFGYAYQDEWPSWNGWKLDVARQMLNDGRGNCYRYAALFMYIAKALGYDADVRCGQVLQRSGWSAHGWTEVYENGGTYVCDLSFYHSLRMNGFYMVPYSNARVNYRISY